MSARPAIRLLLPVIAAFWPMVSQSAFFTDDMGRELSLDYEPERIVTLAPSLTEIVYFLGLGERVVGVTKYSSYPPDAARKPAVGSYVDLNVEMIVGLSPDLVISTADGNQPVAIELLEKAGIPVFVVNPRNLRDVIETLVDIGEVCGVYDRARGMAAELSARVDVIASKTAGRERPLVFLQVNAKPIMTVNASTYSSDLVRLAGGRNMSDDEPITYPRISIEEVIRQKPDVIVISSMERNGEFEEIRQQWLNLHVSSEQSLNLLPGLSEQQRFERKRRAHEPIALRSEYR